MPTYEYKCLDCGFYFEHFQSMKDHPLKICPKCNGKLKKLISAGLGPIFKGSGFYETDYKKKSQVVPKNPDSISSEFKSKASKGKK